MPNPVDGYVAQVELRQEDSAWAVRVGYALWETPVLAHRPPKEAPTGAGWDGASCSECSAADDVSQPINRWAELTPDARGVGFLARGFHLCQLHGRVAKAEQEDRLAPGVGGVLTPPAAGGGEAATTHPGEVAPLLRHLPSLLRHPSIRPRAPLGQVRRLNR